MSESDYRVDFRMTVSELCEAVKGKTVGLFEKDSITGVCTDSRQIKKGDAFFAIKGDNSDGHDHIEEAFKKGASLCIYEREGLEHRGIRVKNSVKALGELAAHARTGFRGKVVGVTGSNGKTTTKNMIASILGQVGKTVSSRGSFNNHIGLPLTILGASKETKFLVLELGMNHSGEISYLAGICRPHVGVITNVGPVHLEFLGDIDGVKKAKGELFEALGEGDWAVANIDDRNVSDLSKKTKARVYGFSLLQREADLFVERRPSGTGSTLVINAGQTVFESELPIPGDHNAYNAAAAVACSLILGAGEKEIKKGLSLVKSGDKRFEIVRLFDSTYLVNDCYNANPVSTEAALREVSRMEGKKYLIFGDMLELGDRSEDLHSEIGRLAAKLGFERLYLIGEKSRFVEKGALEAGIPEENILRFKAHDDVFKEVKRELGEKTVLLVKGSRAMKMEKISEQLIKEVSG